MSKPGIAIIDPVGIKAGLDNYDLSLANALKARIYPVKVYSNFSDSSNDNVVEKQFTFTFDKGFFRKLKLFFEFVAALRKAKGDNSEIVVLHVFHSGFSDYLFIRLAKQFRFRICLIVHDIESFIHQEKSWINKCVSRSEYVVVHNKYSFDELIKKIDRSNENKIAIIPHGGFTRLTDKINRSEALKQFQLDPDFKYLLFFGMIKRSKGLDVLIDAMKMVDEEVHLIIAGRLRDIAVSEFKMMTTKNKLSERIHNFIRYISNDERNLFFSAADVAVLPYRKIYQSGVMIFSMSFGTPVIVSDLSSNKTFINDDNGVLFKEGDASNLALKINQIIFDNERMESMAKNARDYIAVNNNWNAIGDSFIKMFNR